ncbi:MAG: HDOD domain-containing protein [Mariprofundales bacterium]|nr:HDOD domain-containing protein [Mariprofundales bacterium]
MQTDDNQCHQFDSGRYRTLHQLQRFTRSDTVLAHDNITNHRVLLTSTDLSPISQQQQQARQQNLTKLLGLRHPAIPTLLDYGVHEQREWRIHAIGDAPQLLSTVASNMHCNRAQILEITRGVLWGLHALERCGLHHGQLHLDNILLTDGGRHLVITNPLLYQPTRNHRIQDAIRDHCAGTLAPELIANRPGSITSDIYAIGILIHTLATGSSWLDENAPIKPQFHQIIKGLNLTLPDDQLLQKIISSCISRLPSQRPHSAEELLRLLPIKTGRNPSVDPQVKGANSTASQRYWPKPTTIQAAIESAPPAPETPLFNPLHPPAISKQALQRLKQTLQQIQPLPEIWFRIETIMGDPTSGCSELALEVERDPVLTSHILQIANSSSFALPDKRPQTDITMAIARLGIDSTQALLLERVTPKIGHSRHSARAVRSVWLHAQAISLICRTLSTELIHIDSRLAGTIGLLHDIGKLIIIQQQPDEELERLRVRIACGMPELQAERDQLGFTHIDAGMMLALHWQLPHSIHQMVRMHHHPDGLRCDQYSDSMRQYNTLLHTSHLILQQFLPAHQSSGVWQAAIRCRSNDLLTLLNSAGLPRDTTAIITRIDRELQRLFLRFPDVIDSQSVINNPSGERREQGHSP